LAIIFIVNGVPAIVGDESPSTSKLESEAASTEIVILACPAPGLVVSFPFTVIFPPVLNVILKEPVPFDRLTDCGGVRLLIRAEVSDVVRLTVSF
jgi:hypothetical protein